MHHQVRASAEILEQSLHGRHVQRRRARDQGRWKRLAHYARNLEETSMIRSETVDLFLNQHPETAGDDSSTAIQIEIPFAITLGHPAAALQMLQQVKKKERVPAPLPQRRRCALQIVPRPIASDERADGVLRERSQLDLIGLKVHAQLAPYSKER